MCEDKVYRNGSDFFLYIKKKKKNHHHNPMSTCVEFISNTKYHGHVLIQL